MKVLWFSNTPAMGVDYLNKTVKGTGGWLYSLNKYMADNVDLTVVFLYPYQIESFRYNNTNYIPIYTGNIILENLKSKWLGKINGRELLPKYLEVIEKTNPDIIHIHGTENSFLSINDFTEKPIIVSMQGITTVCAHKYTSGLTSKYLKISDLKTDLKSILFENKSFNNSYKKLKKMASFEANVLKNVRYIIGRTDWDYRVTRILAPQSIYFNGNEILRDGFYEHVHVNSELGKKIIIHSTNSNSYFKGFETICAALDNLNTIGLDVEWRVAGIAEDSLINKIVRKELKNHYPRKGLKLLGSLTEDELIDKLKETNIYVMASHIENSPNNLCEAMIMGIPCVATYVGGVGSLVEDKRSGLLIQDGDPWAMAGAIIELTQNWEKALEIGKHARESALDRHNKENIIHNLMDVYQNVIANA